MVLQFGMTATSSTRLRVKTGKIPKMDVCAGLLQLPTACTGGCTTIAIISSSMTKHTLKRTGPCPSLPDRPMNLTGCWEKTCSHSLGSPAETHQVTPHSASTGLLPDLAPVFLTGTRRSLIISRVLQAGIQHERRDSHDRKTPHEREVQHIIKEAFRTNSALTFSVAISGGHAMTISP